MLVKLGHTNKAVTTAGTAVALASSTRVRSVMIQANNANTNNIYVGGSTVSSSSYGTFLTAGNSVTIEAPDMGNSGANDLDLADIYIDADTDGEGVSVTYLYRN